MFTNSIYQIFLRRIHSQAGFSLIEVMVTLVILSFGLLGVSSLLVKGISNSSASESMAKASLLVAGMADQIRVAENPNEYLRHYDDSMPKPLSTSIALADMNRWLKSLDAQLPQGDGEITRDGSTVVIGVRWSNCLGTLSESEKKDCRKKTALASKSKSTFKSITYEVRL